MSRLVETGFVARRWAWPVAVLVLAVGPVASAAQTERSETRPVEEAESLRLYSAAIEALLDGSGGPVYVAGRLRGPGYRLISSDLPEKLVEELGHAGIDADLAELAENGLWQFPRGQLFLMLEPVAWWPGRKIAQFSMFVGTSLNELQEVAFTFKREGGSWILVEKGPPES